MVWKFDVLQISVWLMSWLMSWKFDMVQISVLGHVMAWKFKNGTENSEENEITFLLNT